MYICVIVNNTIIGWLKNVFLNFRQNIYLNYIRWFDDQSVIINICLNSTFAFNDYTILTI